VLPKNIIDWS